MTPEEEAKREERLFQLSEALEASLDAGDPHDDSVWGVRFGLELDEVARVRRGLECLQFGDDAGEGTPFGEALLGKLPDPLLPDDYELLGELGRGGMGIVYRVRQKSLNRELALKVLRPGEMQARRAIQRFEREARSLARLRHPHIASLHEVGESGGLVYFTMDLIEGQSMAALLTEGSVTPSRASRWARQISSALQYVHSHGLVHRDIKPANILIDGDDNACLVDFGLARELEASSDLTLSGHFLGTPAYMAPEQVSGNTKAVGESADIYAVGVVLYECLTGQRPFKGKTLVEVMAAVTAGSPETPSQIDGKIPTGLEMVCMQAMSREVADRYVTAGALLDDLERFESGQRVKAQAPSLRHKLRDTWRHHRVSLQVAGWTASTVAAVFLWALLGPLRVETSNEQILGEAEQLAHAGQNQAALGLFDKYYPEQLDKQALGRWGLAYADALLDEARVANSNGDDARRIETSQRVLALGEAAQKRLAQEPGFQVLAVTVEGFAWIDLQWHERSTQAAALLKDEKAFKKEATQLSLAHYTYGSLKGEPVRIHIQDSEATLTLAFLPELLDSTRLGHERAVVVWGTALKTSWFRAWCEREFDSLPRVISALLRSSDILRGAQLERAIPQLGGSISNRWNPLVGSCDPRELRAALFQALQLGGLSLETESDLLKFCVTLLELPPEHWQDFPVEGLADLLDPSKNDPARDLQRRVNLVAGLLEADADMRRAIPRRWLRGSLGDVPLTHSSMSNLEWSRSIRVLSKTAQSHQNRFLGIRGDEGLAELLQSFDRELRPRHRHIWHERFKAELAPEQFAPIWPGSEPQTLAGRWHGELSSGAEDTIRILQLAAVRFDSATAEPRLRWSTRVEVRPGEPFMQGLEVPLPDVCQAQSSDPKGLVLDIFTATPRAKLELAGELFWGPGGLLANWGSGDSTYDLRHSLQIKWRRAKNAPGGKVHEIAHLQFRRESEGAVLADEWLLGYYDESPGGGNDLPLEQWIAELDLAPDRLASLKDPSARSKLKLIILGGVLLLALLILGGGLVGTLVSLWRWFLIAHRTPAIVAANRAEREAMAPQILLSATFLHFYSGGLPVAAHGFLVAIYSVVIWYACRHLRSRWRFFPALAAGLAAVLLFYSVLSPVGLFEHPRGGRLAPMLYWSSILALPFLFNGYWSWHPDTVKGRRLRKWAHYAIGCTFVAPMFFSWLPWFPDSMGTSMFHYSWNRGGLPIWFQLLTYLGLEIWVGCLILATRHRSREVLAGFVKRQTRISRG